MDGEMLDCGEWNTIVEERTSSSRAKHQPWLKRVFQGPVAITEVVSAAESCLQRGWQN